MKNLFVCSTCNTEDKLVTDLESGEVVCTTCGTVIAGQVEDPRRELDQNAVRGLRIVSGFGPHSSLATHDMNLSTLIGKSNRDSSGRIISSNTLAKMTKLRAWHMRTQLADTSARNFSIAFSLLNNLRDKLSVPDSVIESTAYIYRKIEHKGIVRGKTIPSVLAACLYLTCREMGVPRTMAEIQKASNVKKKQIARDYREIVQSLELYVPPVNYLQCLEKISNNLELDGKIRRKGMKLMQSIVEREISAGKDPMGLAASVLYIILQSEGQTIRQAEIANAAGISEVTLRARTRGIKNKLPLNS
jgi:transcription initiation factor TFIIB